MRWGILMPCAVALVATATGCGDNIPAAIELVAPSAWSSALAEFVALTPRTALSLTVSDGTAELATASDYDGYRLVVVDDPSLAAESYRIDPVVGAVRAWTIRTHDVLGAQYGAAEALENLGFRFRHPSDTLVPSTPVFDTTATLGVVHAPDVRVRGLQLHTLHPIEGYFAFWEPGAGNMADAHRIIDWLVKNRGNYLQWVALDDIQKDAGRRAAWLDYTRELIDEAHARGIRVGIGAELFGQSNLQLAYDLYDDTTGKVLVHDQIAQRLPLLTSLPWDVYSLSYGEFFDADAQAFIDGTDEVARQLKAAAPAAELHAVVHDGFFQRVMFQGQNLIYYFLVKFADPSVIPDIHTTMYFDLFEDAGSAYQHPTFEEHRQYLVDRMCAHQKAAYYPEDAYWVAFDDSVPQYDPLYVRSRWLDRDKLATAAPPPCDRLDEHLVFSSGWEWGFWLHDVSVLRDSYEHAASPAALIAYAYAPDLGSAAAQIVADTAELQDTAMITQRLAPYVAGRDIAIDTGRLLNIISQPDRVTFDQLVTMSADDRAAFAARILDPLATYADGLAALRTRLGALALPATRWAAEVSDGLAVDETRARYAIALYRAILAHVAGDDGAARAQDAAANDLMARGAAIVEGRHADLHDTHGRRLLDRTDNQTYYKYGYLFMADSLCFWHRELDQVEGVLGNSTAVPPSCLLGN